MIMGAWGFGRKRGWTNPYVADGLIAMWDGEWNAGGGVHDASATVWKDLVGSDDFTIDSAGIWGDKSISNGETYNRIAYRNDFTFAMPMTQEIVMKYKGNQSSNAVIFHVSQWADGNDMLRGMVVLFGAYFKVRSDTTGYSLPVSHDAMTLACLYDSSGTPVPYINGVAETLLNEGTDTWWANDATGVNIANRANNNRGTKIEIFGIRFYSRALTAEEIAANYAVDKQRFNLP